jgi:hypothetical protein
MRLGPAWTDVCIRNISARGLMVTAAIAAPRGTYVELRRGRHIVVAQIVWTRDNSFGLHTQDRLPVDAIVAEPDRTGLDFKRAVAAQPRFDRRAAPRREAATCPPQRSERSRMAARAMEFAATAMAGGVFASLIALAVVQAVSGPMATIGGALNAPGAPRQQDAAP